MTTTMSNTNPVDTTTGGASRRSASELAIYGGPKTVTETLNDKWRTVTWREIARIAKRAWNQEVTSFNKRGPVGVLERAFASRTGSALALAVNSGTASLHSAYFGVGVRPGDEVIVPAYTFVATASPLLQLGAKPIFCDIDSQTLTADPDHAESLITDKTKAICVVHLWGNPARMDRFVEITRKHGIALIEDCSHAHGATFDGKPVGSFGDAGCFSMQGQKPVSGGELGIVTTNDPDLYDRMLLLGHLGRTGDRINDDTDIGMHSLGMKFRPHLYGIILAQGGLSRLDEMNGLRRKNYKIIADALQDCPALDVIDAYKESERGGLLEFLIRYKPEHAGGWSRGAFMLAARAEGVPIYVDRYSVMNGRGARLLLEAPLFKSLDYSQFGGPMASVTNTTQTVADVPNADHVVDTLLTLPPFTRVEPSYIHGCVRAMRKVIDVAAICGDVRQ